MFLYSLLSVPAIDVFEPIAKWLTISVLSALLILGAVLYFVKRNAFVKYAKYAFLGAFAYLLTIAIVFFVLDISNHYSDAYAEENWLDKDALVRYVLIPLIVFSSVALLSLATFALTNKFAQKYHRLCGIIGGALSALALIAVLICIAIYYNVKIDGDGYYNSDTATVQQLFLYIGAILTVALIIGLATLDKQAFHFDARSLAYAGILASMSFALSYIKLWDMPQGGSITLVSTLPLMLYAYLFGTKKGVFVGFVYGILQSVQDPWIIHPAQFLLDYPIAFSAIGLAGIFGESKFLEKATQARFALGATIAGALRFICHVLSGVFAFEAYAEGQNAWAYSLAYNSFVFIDVAFVIIAGLFVLSSNAFLSATTHLRKNNKKQK